MPVLPWEQTSTMTDFCPLLWADTAESSITRLRCLVRICTVRLTIVSAILQRPETHIVKLSGRL